MCDFRLYLCINAASHHEHLNGRSPVWTSTWYLRPERLAKATSHMIHLKGRSPVWLRRWHFRLAAAVKVTPHTTHWKGLSPVWICMCLFRLPSFENADPQMWHTNLKNASVDVSPCRLQLPGCSTAESVSRPSWKLTWLCCLLLDIAFLLFLLRCLHPPLLGSLDTYNMIASEDVSMLWLSGCIISDCISSPILSSSMGSGSVMPSSCHSSLQTTNPCFVETLQIS